jgi:hypothetical protein
VDQGTQAWRRFAFDFRNEVHSSGETEFDGLNRIQPSLILDSELCAYAATTDNAVRPKTLSDAT